jgi:hypothetical protein
LSYYCHSLYIEYRHRCSFLFSLRCFCRPRGKPFVRGSRDLGKCTEQPPPGPPPPLCLTAPPPPHCCVVCLHAGQQQQRLRRRRQGCFARCVGVGMRVGVGEDVNLCKSGCVCVQVRAGTCMCICLCVYVCVFVCVQHQNRLFI